MTGETRVERSLGSRAHSMLWGKGARSSRAELRHCQHGVRRSEQLQGLARPERAVSSPSGGRARREAGARWGFHSADHLQRGGLGGVLWCCAAESTRVGCLGSAGTSVVPGSSPAAQCCWSLSYADSFWLS